MHGHHTAGQHDAPGARRALVVLAGAMVLGLSTWYSVTAALPALRSELALAPSDVRWISIALPLGFAAGALLSAAAGWPDRWGPRHLAATGSFGAAAANLLPVAVPTLGAVTTGRALTGACLALVYPSLLKATATWYRQGRGVAIATMIAALTVGTATPHLVRAFQPDGASWRLVLAATSALAVSGGLLALRGATDGPFLATRSAFDPRALPSLVRDRGTRLACLGYFGHMWELYAAWAVLPAFFTSLVANTRHASMLSFAVVAAGAAGCLLGAVTGERVGRATAARWALTASAGLGLAVGFVHRGPLPIVVGLCLLWGMALIADGPQFTALVAEHAPPERVGTAITLQLALGFTLTSVTLWLVPFVQQHAGWAVALGVLAPGPLVAALAMRALETRPIPRTTGAAPWTSTSAHAPAVPAR